MKTHEPLGGVGIGDRRVDPREQQQAKIEKAQSRAEAEKGEEHHAPRQIAAERERGEAERNDRVPLEARTGLPVKSRASDQQSGGHQQIPPARAAEGPPAVADAGSAAPAGAVVSGGTARQLSQSKSPAMFRMKSIQLIGQQSLGSFTHSAPPLQ